MHFLRGSRESKARKTNIFSLGVTAASLLFTLGAGPQRQLPPESSDRVSRETPLSVKELLERADTVVYGTITQLESGWNKDRKIIYTTVVVRVERTVKGEARRAVSFRFAGGQVGNLRTRISHFPTFEVGEEVLLFLQLSKPNPLSPLINVNQGKFTVRRDPKTDVPFVHVVTLDIPVFSAATGREVAPKAREGGRVPLDDLLYSLQRQTGPRSPQPKGGAKP